MSLHTVHHAPIFGIFFPARQVFALNRRSFLHGFLQLTLSSVLLRGVGMAYRVVLQGRIGAEGMGLYQLIMTVYMLFSMVSCAGLTITVSRLCAEHPDACRSITAKSCLYAALLGTGLGALLFALSGFTAESLLGDARAAGALRWIAPSLPLMGISAVLRGYFLSMGDAARPTIAQITEQLARVGLVLALLYLFDITELSQACAVILFGATAAELLSCAMHIAFAAKLFKSPCRAAFPIRDILRGIFPILLGSAAQSGMQTAENLLIPRLIQLSGISPAQSLAQYGMLGGMVLPVLMFPAALPAALGTLLLPEIARQNALGRAERVRALIRRTLSSTALSSLLCSAVLFVFAQPVMQLLYKSEAAAGQLMLLCPLLPMLCTDALCDALLKGLSKQTATMLIEILDGITRIAGLFALLPRMGMMGCVIVLYLSAFLCSLCRLLLLHRKTPRISSCEA